MFLTIIISFFIVLEDFHQILPKKSKQCLINKNFFLALSLLIYNKQFKKDCFIYNNYN